MIGLIFAILLIVAGSALGLRKEGKPAGDFSARWRSEDLPGHEAEQEKRL
jgi:hypothetical protein